MAGNCFDSECGTGDRSPAFLSVELASKFRVAAMAAGALPTCMGDDNIVWCAAI